MPTEEALMAFAEIDISRMKNFTSEKEKGIPFISFVMKEKEGAVFTGPHPLFIADSLLRVFPVTSLAVTVRPVAPWSSSSYTASVP